MLKKGDIVLCDTCEKALYKFTRDAELGDDVEETLLRPLLPQPKVKNGELCFCKHCKNVVHFTKFRTKSGKSLDFSNENLLF